MVLSPAYGTGRGASGVVTIAPASKEILLSGPKGATSPQGWDTVPGNSPADFVTKTVLGQSTRVVRLNDDGAALFGVRSILSARDWQEVFDFGASFGGIVSLDPSSLGSNGCFVLLQCDSEEIPASAGAPFVGTNRRYGFSIDRGGTGELRFIGSDGSFAGVIFAGAQTLADEFYEFQVRIPPGFGNAELLVRPVGSGPFTSLTTSVQFAVNTGGTGTQCVWTSGSSAGIARVTHMFVFGYTIYQTFSTITLTDADFSGDETRIIIPIGVRDWTINASASLSGVSKGHLLSIKAQNAGGNLTLEDTNEPPVLTLNQFSSLRLTVDGVLINESFNRIEGSHDYAVRFQQVGVAAAGVTVLR